MSGQVARVWRPTPSGIDHTGKRTSSRRIVVWLPQPDPPQPRITPVLSAGVFITYPWNPREWLRSACGSGSRPESCRTAEGGRGWAVARPHFRRVVDALARRYGVVDVWADHTVTSACGRLCREALGEECSCGCLGENHGGQQWRKEWIKVSDHWLIENVKIRTRYRVDSAGWQKVGKSA